MEGRGEIIVIALGVAVDEADQEGECGCRQQGYDEVGLVAQFADEGSLKENEKLRHLIAPPHALPSLCPLHQDPP